MRKGQQGKEQPISSAPFPPSLKSQRPCPLGPRVHPVHALCTQSCLPEDQECTLFISIFPEPGG